MSQLKQQPLYDPLLTCQDNFEHGPFGSFRGPKSYRNRGQPMFDFFGTPVYSPFGIAAGPLPTARFVQAALHKGFDIVTFKSARTTAYPCHPFPNIMPVDVDVLDPTNTDSPIRTKANYDWPLSLSNSFGIPSREPSFWQAEIKKSLSLLNPGQALLAAFQGTDRGEGRASYIADHVRGVKLLGETGAKIIEVNLSCPNEGSTQLLCFDTATTREIIEAIRMAVPSIKLIVKIAYFADHAELTHFVAQVGPLVDGITAINTIAARVVDHANHQAYPGGADRAKPGVSGHAIFPAGLEMTRRLFVLRKRYRCTFQIIGVGGVLSPREFFAYRAAGADVVMSATGAMWNPSLAAEIKKALKTADKPGEQTK